jgi:hypothetical protein
MHHEKGNLVIARRETYCSYEDSETTIEYVKSLYDWQPYCYIGIKGKMMCSGRHIKQYDESYDIHDSCFNCIYWKNYKED